MFNIGETDRNKFAHPHVSSSLPRHIVLPRNFGSPAQNVSSGGARPKDPLASSVQNIGLFKAGKSARSCSDIEDGPNTPPGVAYSLSGGETKPLFESSGLASNASCCEAPLHVRWPLLAKVGHFVGLYKFPTDESKHPTAGIRTYKLSSTGLPIPCDMQTRGEWSSGCCSVFVLGSAVGCLVGFAICWYT